MIALIQRTYFILTDSSGIQEEAPSLHKPMLVLREVNEHYEVMALGAAKLVSTNRDRIVAEASRLMEDPVAYQRTASFPNPHSDSQDSRQIVAALPACA